MSEFDQAAVDQALAIADDVANGQVCLLEACRRIVPLRHRLGAIPEELLDPIRVVESELDDVPNEAAASRWEPEALRQRLQERDEYLEQVRPLLLRSFSGLRSCLGSSSRKL